MKDHVSVENKASGRARLKNFVYSHPKTVGAALKGYNTLNLSNRIRICAGNRLICNATMLSNVKVTIKGKGNIVFIGEFSLLKDCRITIFGNDNTINIGKRCKLNQADLYIEDSNNTINIGTHTNIAGRTHLAAIESTKIIIGEECLFSSEVHFRTGDSHSIIDEQGKRINPSKSIVIGNHCWIGTKVTCLKGTEIAENTIVGAGSILAKKYAKPNCILAGVPATVIKENVNWKSERIQER